MDMLAFTIEFVVEGGCGGAADNELTSGQGEPGSIPDGVAPVFSYVGWLVGFLGDILPRPCIPALLHTRLASPALALETTLYEPLKSLHPTALFLLRLAENRLSVIDQATIHLNKMLTQNDRGAARTPGTINVKFILVKMCVVTRCRVFAPLCQLPESYNVTDVQQDGQDGRQGTGMTVCKQLRRSAPPRPLSSSRPTFSWGKTVLRKPSTFAFEPHGASFALSRFCYYLCSELSAREPTITAIRIWFPVESSPRILAFENRGRSQRPTIFLGELPLYLLLRSLAVSSQGLYLRDSSLQCALTEMWPDCSSPTTANRVRFPTGHPPPPGSSHVGIAPGDVAGRRVFSGISRLPCPRIPSQLHARIASPSSALKTSMLRPAILLSLAQLTET
ncbi:hypothetical protein PR048_008076 [Dryococelus australis]|uniref:Uncharacterized protein n=1 Tax=Dryococelus australis TaxID=614101 RepID=A0ABQ9HW23_9NEOP|nr:hypothetical protein PR048_008076 [Dryococelus australis]